MAQQQVQSLYVGIPEISAPVLPEVALRGKNWFETQAYGQDVSNGVISNGVIFIDDSRSINKVAYALKKARPRYNSLLDYGMNQKLLQENKVPEEFLRNTFEKFDGDIWQRYWIWAELMDSLPEKRGHKLPKGKNVALYRGAKVSGETVDAKGVEPVFLSLPKEDGTITEEWKNALGASADTYHHPADLDYSKTNLGGLNALHWAFGGRVRPYLYSSWEPSFRLSVRGSLLGSRLSADEIVKNLQPIKAEPKPKISQYQVELKGLEEDLDSSKKLYKDLGKTITSIEERLANLKKLKPE